MKELKKKVVNRSEQAGSLSAFESRQVEATATVSEKKVFEATKKALGTKKATKKIFNFRFDESMMEDFKIYCEATNTDMSKELTKMIQLVIMNNQGLIHDKRK